MYDFIIIGGAQAGLAMAYFLKKQKKRFLIVDKSPEVGFSWLNRWDSLRLFTPTEFNHLPGMDFPASKGHYPSKTEVAEYFKLYAQEFDFPMRQNTLVTKVEKKAGRFLVHSKEKTFESKGVVVATGPFHIPYTPPCHINIDRAIFQTHSNSYKNVDQLKEGSTLVVGAGDSGYQILDEVSATGRKTYFSGDLDVRMLPQEILGKTLWWWFTITGFLSVSRNSWLGKRLLANRQPVIGTDVKSILGRDNVIPVGRTNSADGIEIETEEKVLTDVKNVVWATGYRPNFSWIEGLETTKDDYPKNKRGISPIENLFFIGLPWLYTRGSATLGGVRKDARYLSDYIEDNF